MKYKLSVCGVVLVALAGCGSSSEAVDSKEIDRKAWRAELVKLDPASDPDLDALEAVIREDCTSTVDDLALQFSLSGSQPDVIRTSMKFVCPDQAGKVDKALTQLQEVSDGADKACATAPNLRTQDQADMAEALGCDE